MLRRSTNAEGLAWREGPDRHSPASIEVSSPRRHLKSNFRHFSGNPRESTFRRKNRALAAYQPDQNDACGNRERAAKPERRLGNFRGCFKHLTSEPRRKCPERPLDDQNEPERNGEVAHVASAIPGPLAAWPYGACRASGRACSAETSCCGWTAPPAAAPCSVSGLEPLSAGAAGFSAGFEGAGLGGCAVFPVSPLKYWKNWESGLSKSRVPSDFSEAS